MNTLKFRIKILILLDNLDINPSYFVMSHYVPCFVHHFTLINHLIYPLPNVLPQPTYFQPVSFTFSVQIKKIRKSDIIWHDIVQHSESVVYLTECGKRLIAHCAMAFLQLYGPLSKGIAADRGGICVHRRRSISLSSREPNPWTWKHNVTS